MGCRTKLVQAGFNTFMSSLKVTNVNGVLGSILSPISSKVLLAFMTENGIKLIENSK